MFCASAHRIGPLKDKDNHFHVVIGTTSANLNLNKTAVAAGNQVNNM
jgi:hypothetical protein